jgi:hypothetical protein
MSHAQRVGPSVQELDNLGLLMNRSALHSSRQSFAGTRSVIAPPSAAMDMRACVLS